MSLQLQSIRNQRRTESPVFWVIVLASSLLIHLVLALGLRSLLVQAIRVPVEPEPIAVEFAEATDEVIPSLSKQSQPFSSQAAVSNPVPAPPPPTTQPPISPPETSSANLPPSSPKSETTLATPEPVRPVLPSPRPSSPPASRPHSVSPPASPPPAPLTSPVPNRVTPTDSVASSLNNRLSNPAVRGPIASGIRLPDLPDVPNPADNPGRTSKSPGSPISPLAIAKTPTPARFLAQIQLLPAGDKGAIAHSPASTPATIQGERSKEFMSDTSACLLTPEALAAFGKAVVLKAALNEQGQMQGEPTVLAQNSSGNSRYDELAVCVLKQWTFSPAYEQVDENTRSVKPATIYVEVKITE